jgi:hypothetical protein
VHWIWHGTPFSFTKAGSFSGEDRFEFDGAGLNLDGVFVGATSGGTLDLEWVEWTELVELKSILTHAFENDGGRLGFLPHHLHLDEGMLVRVDNPVLSRPDVRKYQSNDRDRRILSLTLEFEGIFL